MAPLLPPWVFNGRRSRIDPDPALFSEYVLQQADAILRRAVQLAPGLHDCSEPLGLLCDAPVRPPYRSSPRRLHALVSEAFHAHSPASFEDLRRLCGAVALSFHRLHEGAMLLRYILVVYASRVVELLAVLDRCAYARENGLALACAQFVDPRATPRNILLTATP